MKDDMKLLGLQPEWAIFRDMRRDLIWGKRLTNFFKMNDDDDEGIGPSNCRCSGPSCLDEEGFGGCVLTQICHYMIINYMY